MEAVKVQYLNGNLFSMDNSGNLIGVNLSRNGVPYSGGGSVSASVIRADGATVAVTGALSGNLATVVLPQSAYVVPGVLSVVIKLTVSGEVATIGAIVSNVYQSSTDTTVDPGTIIPSITALIAEIEAAVATIPADYSALWTSIAPAFSSSASYGVGQYVTYDGAVYRFVSIHAGSWNASDVERISVGNDLYTFGNALSFDEQMLNAGVCLFASGDFEQGSINTSGANTASAKVIRTRTKMHVKKGMQIVFTAGTHCTHLGLRIYNPDGTLTNPSWIEKRFPYTFANDADLRMVIKSGAAAADDLAPSQYDAVIAISTVIDKTTQKSKYASPVYGVELFDYYADDVENGMAIIPEISGQHMLYNTLCKALPYVRINEGDMLCLSGDFTDSTTYAVDFFNEDFSYNSYKYTNHANSMIKAPTGAKYVRLSKFTSTTMKAFIISSTQMNENSGEMGFVPLDMYGTFDGYKMSEIGIVQTATTLNMSLSNYIPVTAGGKIWNISTLDNSGTWGMMFYTSAMEAVENGFVLNNTNIVNIPETAAFVRFTFLTDDNHGTQYYYIPNGSVMPEINVKEFGAVGDKKTDDTRILQKMINIGGRSGAVIYIPRGNYLITSPLVIRYNDTSIRGDKWEVYSGSRIIMQTYAQTVDENGNIIYEETSEGSGIQKLADNPVEIGFRVINYGFSIRDITFIPNFKQQGALWYDAQNLVATAIYVKVNIMDVDGQITGCHFRGCNVCISASGRNIEIGNCLFVHSNVGVDIRWEQKYATEQREINVTNSRFHSCGKNRYNKSVAYDSDRVCIKFPDYIDPNLGKAFNVRDNFADYCGIFISGVMFGADVSMNTSFQCRNAFINSHATVISPSGDGTTISGNALLGANPETDKGVNAHSMEIKESEGKTLTDVIDVTEGQVLRIGFKLNTRVWGHALLNSNGDIVDCIVANREGDYIIPEGITGIRLTLITSQISNCSITIFDSYDIVSASEEIGDLTPISIHDNRVIGATETDYTYGRNILEDAVIIKGYKNLIIDSNEFNNGVGNVINLDNCKKISITNNKMVNSPSYCEVYNEDGDLTEHPDGAGKNYIKLTDCDRYVIIDNVAISGNRYDGSTTPYVSIPISVNGSEYTDSSNRFINGAE